MKIISKQILPICMAVILTLLTFPFSITALAAPAPSPWAVEQVNAAIAANLVPSHLQSNYIQPITRAEFCALAIALYESLRGEITGRTAFTDTNDINVQKAAYIGIVSGMENNRFNPGGTLTREQAAVILSRLLGLFDIAVQELFPDFYDMNEVSYWAVNAVANVEQAGIMSGVGNNRFAPQQPYTREQSMVTIMRMFELLNNENNFAGYGTPHSPATTNSEDPYIRSSFEVGQVTLIANGIEHQPGIHHMHSGGYMDDGSLMSASGIRFDIWLRENLSSLPEIQYTGNLQVVFEGEDGSIVTHPEPVSEDEDLRLIKVFAENFSNGIAHISFPYDAGVYLLYVDVHWSGGGNPFTLLRYVFKIVK